MFNRALLFYEISIEERLRPEPIGDRQKDAAFPAMLTLEKDSIELALKNDKHSIAISNNNNNNSESDYVDIKNGKKSFDLSGYTEEEERLNIRAWKYFDELTAVVNKLDKLSIVLNEIQGLLHTVVRKDSSDVETPNLERDIE